MEHGKDPHLLEEALNLLLSVLRIDPTLGRNPQLLDSIRDGLAGVGGQRSGLALALVVLGRNLASSSEGLDGREPLDVVLCAQGSVGRLDEQGEKRRSSSSEAITTRETRAKRELTSSQSTA